MRTPQTPPPRAADDAGLRAPHLGPLVAVVLEGLVLARWVMPRPWRQALDRFARWASLAVGRPSTAP